MSRSRSRYRVVNGIAFATTLASVMLAGSVILSQAPPRRQVVYTSEIQAPPGTTPEQFELPPSEYEVASAFQQALGRTAAGVDASRAAVPPIPWNEHGLAHVAVDPGAIVWNEEAGRYEAALADGRTAVLTLERPIQDHLERLVARYQEPGEAVVLLEADTGRVLALVDDSSGPHVGEGLARRAPAFAASTFKVISGAAFLGEEVATTGTSVCYSGGSSGFSLEQLNASDGGTCHTLAEGMARSANLVFGRLADQNLEPATLQQYAEDFGYNRRIPFEMPLERSVARIPTDSRLEFARSAAGFRHTWLTPLHGALIQAGIANGGVMMAPTIVDHIEDANGNTVWSHTPTEWRRALPEEVAAAVSRTMEDTCTIGTARGFFAERDGWPAALDVLGKTGTLSNRPVEGPAPNPVLTFSWFTGYGDVQGRTLAVAGLVVNEETWWIKGGYLAAEAMLVAFQNPPSSAQATTEGGDTDEGSAAAP